MSRLTIPTLICEECGRPYQSSAYQARYCTLRCKQKAADKRRRLKDAGILAGRTGETPAEQIASLPPEDLEAKRREIWEASERALANKAANPNSGVASSTPEAYAAFFKSAANCAICDKPKAVCTCPGGPA